MEAQTPLKMFLVKASYDLHVSSDAGTWGGPIGDNVQTVGVLGAGHGAGGGRRVHGGGGGRGLEHSRQREAGHGTESHTQRLGRGLQSVVLSINRLSGIQFIGQVQRSTQYHLYWDKLYY